MEVAYASLTRDYLHTGAHSKAGFPGRQIVFER